MLLLSNYFKWPFCAILAAIFFQTLLQPAHGNTDTIYTEMHDKLLHFQKIAKRIVEDGTMDSFIKEAYDKREKNIKYRTSDTDKISKIMEQWRSEGTEILDDYLTLRQKDINPSMVEKMRTKWEQIVLPLNEHDGKHYSEHQLEEIQKEANKNYLWKFLDVTNTENATFFKHLALKCNHYLGDDSETIKIKYTYTDLYGYVRLMAGIRLLKEHGVEPSKQHDSVHNVHPEHPAAVAPAKSKSVDHAVAINIWALTSIVEWLYGNLNRQHGIESAQRLKDRYPTFEQRNQILEETNSILKASNEIPYRYSAEDDKPIELAKARFENKLDTMMQVKRVEPKQMLEYFTELVFYEWAKKTNFGTIKSETNDAHKHKHMAETEIAMEEMKDQEEAASSNIGDLKTDAKGKRKRKKEDGSVKRRMKEEK